MVGKSVLPIHSPFLILEPMELLNIKFALLIFKMAICILPGVGGIFLIVSPEESKRGMRNYICNQVFGVSNAIAYPKFARTLAIIGALLILFSLGATWYFLLRKMI